MSSDVTAGVGRRWPIIVVIGAVAILIRLLAPFPVVLSDEQTWLRRSHVFSQAISSADFREATPLGVDEDYPKPTMPGVTVMWAGTIGVAIARTTGNLGLTEPVHGATEQSAPAIRAVRDVVTLISVLGLMVLMLAVWELFGRGVAVVTGVVLATEPWIAAYSNLVHLDVLIATFSAVSVFALAVGVRALGVPLAKPRWRWIVVSAVMGGLALLTKIGALGVVGPGCAFVLAQVVARRFRGEGLSAKIARDTLRSFVAVVGAWLALAAVTIFVLWPALWVTPMEQYRGVLWATDQANIVRPHLYRGQPVTGGDWGYYLAVFAIRLTPWCFVLCVTGLVGALVKGAARVTRRRSFASLTVAPVWVLLAPLPFLLVISSSALKYGRYLIPVLPFLIVAGAIVVMGVVRDLSHRASWARGALTAVAVVLTVFAAGSTIRMSPCKMVGPESFNEGPAHACKLTYASPIVGGEPTSRYWIQWW